MKTGVRPLWKDILAAIWLGIILPGIVLQFCVFIHGKAPEEQRAIPQETESSARYISLRMDKLGGLRAMDMDSYLTGVLLAEMPAFFEEEALKAQAVAARTYTMKAVLSGGKHGDGSLCNSPGCCQGFLTETEFLSRGGSQDLLDKVRDAVTATDSYVLIYDGELIEAVYFSSSGGKTESALAVWGADYPYLQSVASPGEEADAYTGRIMTIPVSEFSALFNISLDNEPETWFSDILYTEGGGVDQIRIGEENFTGIQLRGLLKLPSTAFSITTDGENVVIVTHGYGHRVGLSQYGANSMAKHGSSYREILKHYYPGTSLVSMH